jgi:catechol 2,3-dioxygenase-like lactoylglutathione lyase family enzyme
MPESAANPQLLSTESRLGAVHIAVTNADRTRDFWTNTLGLTELESSDATIRLGVGTAEKINIGYDWFTSLFEQEVNPKAPADAWLRC